MTALDIGANVGAYALLIGQWVGSGGAVFAFEPAPDAHDGLQRHIHLNALDAIVTPVRAAAGAASSTSRLVVGTTAGESRLVTLATDDAATTVDVPVTTIDDFCAREHLTPDFIKIDVEGAELDVLRGARETIRRTRGRLSLFVEIHPSIWRTSGVTLDDVRAELDAQQLDAVPLAPTGDPGRSKGSVCGWSRDPDAHSHRERRLGDEGGVQRYLDAAVSGLLDVDMSSRSFTAIQSRRRDACLRWPSCRSSASPAPASTPRSRPRAPGHPTSASRTT